MPVPLIAGAAAAVAARLAAKKAAQELAKKAAKAATTKTAQIAKNSVKTKPARKQVGNPPNDTKDLEDYISSISRVDFSSARASAPGKAKAKRIANSKLSKKTVRNVKEPARRPIPDNRPPFNYKTIEINSAVKSKTADQARSNNAARKPAPASVPARKPANPARATVKINSAKSVRVVKVTPRKKSATELRPKKK